MPDCLGLNRSKFQTNNPATVVPNGFMIGKIGFARRCGKIMVSVLVIEY